MSGGIHQRVTECASIGRGSRADRTVGADQGYATVAAQIKRLVEPGQIERINGNRDHAGELAIWANHAPGELDRRFIEEAEDDRLTDERLVVGAFELEAKVLAVA